MPKEDYLLKYLEKLSRVVAVMLGLREKGFPEDALRLADEIYNELLNIDLETLSAMSVEDFDRIARKANFNSTYLNALAGLTSETAYCYAAKDDIMKMRLFSEKALLLYLFLNEKAKYMTKI
jgi:hypothetical protein